MNSEDERRLESIGFQLCSDPTLSRVLGAPTAREKRLLRLRDIVYPSGFLLVVTVYAFSVCGAAVVPVLAPSIAVIALISASFVAVAKS